MATGLLKTLNLFFALASESPVSGTLMLRSTPTKTTVGIIKNGKLNLERHEIVETQSPGDR